MVTAPNGQIHPSRIHAICLAALMIGLFASVVVVYRTPETWLEARQRAEPGKKVELSTPKDLFGRTEQLLGRAAVLVGLCIPAAFGLLPLLPLFLGSGGSQPKLRLFASDIACLVVIQVIALATWSKLPGVVKLGPLHMGVAVVLAAACWFVGLVALKMANVDERLSRAMVLGVVIPTACLAPVFAGIIMLGRQTAAAGLPDFSSGDVSLIGRGLVYLLSFMMVQMLPHRTRRDESGEPMVR